MEKRDEDGNSPENRHRLIFFSSLCFLIFMLLLYGKSFLSNPKGNAYHGRSSDISYKKLVGASQIQYIASELLLYQSGFPQGSRIW